MSNTTDGIRGYGLIGLASKGLDELLGQVELTIDHYRSVFFSSNKPSDPALELGNLAAELRILADVVMSLHSLQQAVEKYEKTLNEITGAIPDDRVSPRGLFLVPWPTRPDINEQTPLPLDDLPF